MFSYSKHAVADFNWKIKMLNTYSYDSKEEKVVKAYIYAMSNLTQWVEDGDCSKRAFVAAVKKLNVYILLLKEKYSLKISQDSNGLWILDPSYVW